MSMKISKRAFINMLDSSFEVADKDVESRWAKAVILCGAASEEYNTDYACRLTYVKSIFGLLKDIEHSPGEIICTCQAVKRLGYEDVSQVRYSNTKDSERRIVNILENVNEHTVYDMIESQVD